MIRTMTLLLTMGVLALFAQTASAAENPSYDDGGFGTGSMSSGSYTALSDPSTEDPSTIEPAAGDEELPPSDDQIPEDSNSPAPAEDQDPAK